VDCAFSASQKHYCRTHRVVRRASGNHVWQVRFIACPFRKSYPDVADQAATSPSRPSGVPMKPPRRWTPILVRAGQIALCQNQSQARS
jgi:hypothetical protein